MLEEKNGYYGRVAVAEMLAVSAKEREALARGKNAAALMDALPSYTPLTAQGLMLAKEGVTTMEELQRVIPFDT